MNPFPAFVLFVAGAMIYRAAIMSDWRIVALIPVALILGKAMSPAPD